MRDFAPRSLLCFSFALSFGAALAADPPSARETSAQADTITLPLPWKAGQALRYQFEQVDSDVGPDKREKSTSHATMEVKTVEAGKDGFVQEWRSFDNRQEVLEGDKAQAKMISDAMKGLEDIAIVVEAGSDGSYKRVRNLEAVGKRLHEAMAPVMRTLINDSIEKEMAGQPTDKRAQALQEASDSADAFLASFTSGQMLENLLTRDIQGVLNFSGASLENDQAYELETELENPTGGAPFPGKLTFGLYVDQEEPEDVWLDWTMEIDPIKGAVAVWETVERLYGRKIDEAERKALPVQVSIVDKGFIVFERATGVAEMYQSERTSKIAEHAKYQRSRMRLVGQRHEHEWSEGIPQDTDPALSAAEQDAQLCASDGADVQAAIAACTRLLEQAGIGERDRVRWYAARAEHRLRGKQPAQMRADLDRALQLAPDDVALRLRRVAANVELQDYPAAEADARKAASLDPKSALAQVFLGGALEKQSRFADALPHYDRAVQLAPGAATPYDARCWGRAMAGDFDGAKSDCDHALALDANAHNALNSRGYVHYRAGRFAESIRDYDAAIAAAPDIASSWYVRGLARRALGDAAGADADIAKALQLEPNVVERYAGYGVK